MSDKKTDLENLKNAARALRLSASILQESVNRLSAGMENAKKFGEVADTQEEHLGIAKNADIAAFLASNILKVAQSAVLGYAAKCATSSEDLTKLQAELDANLESVKLRLVAVAEGKTTAEANLDN